MHKFLKGYHLDLRSLALMRILLAIFLMVELSYYFIYQEVFLQDFGVIPREVFLDQYAFTWSWSLFYINGHAVVVNLLLLLGSFSSLMVLVGYRTKLFSLICWLLIVSLHNRNWFIINAGDDLLRIFFFLGIFLPWGNYFSIDHALAKNRNDIKPTIYHPASWWFIVQICVVYLFSYLYKTNPIWRSDFTAIFYALQLDLYTTFIGKTINEWRGLLKAISAFVVFLELYGPLLFIFHGLLFSYKNYLRTLIIFLFISFHLGILITMTVGQFPYISIAIWLGLLPSSFWNYFQKKSTSLNQIIYYDGNCNFCYKGVLLVKEFFSIKSPVYAAKVNSHVDELMQEKNSWVVFDDIEKQYYFGFKAFTELIKSKWYYSLFANKLVSILGEKVYLLISHNRSTFSKLTKGLKSFKLTTSYSYLLSIIIIFFTSGTLVWNINSLSKVHIPSTFQIEAFRYLHLYQHWDMFSPKPKLDDVWFSFEGKFKNGHYQKLFFPENSALTEKEIYEKYVKDKYWRKMLSHLEDNKKMQQNFIRYLCRRYNIKEYDKEKSMMTEVTVNEYSQMNTLSGESSKIIKKLPVTIRCFK